ncbi:MAG: signal peptidase II [bacterium]|nr:signal peptidase II [bacterium]
MRRPYWIAAGTVAALFVVDRLSRSLAFARPSRHLIGSLLRSEPTTNVGVALGIPIPGFAMYVLLIVLISIVGALGWAAFRKHQLLAWWASLLVFTGAISNLLDRLHYGYVRDFLQFSFWPTTANFGDWMVTVGAILLLISSLRPPPRET